MGRGLVARQPGDTFVKDEHNLQLETVILQYDSTKISGTLASRKISNKTFVNPYRTDYNGAIACIFTDDKKEKHAFVRYVKQIKNRGYGQWSNAKFARDTGYKMRDTLSEFETLPLSPRELIGCIYKLPQDEVFQKLEENIKDIDDPFRRDIKEIIYAIKYDQESPCLSGSAKYIQPYAKALGEVVAPLAYSKDWNIRGKIAIASRPKMYGTNFIQYPWALNNPLYDSEVNNIKLSSKWLSGAEASVASLYKLYKNHEHNFELSNQYEEEAKILQLINGNSMYVGPMALAVYIGLIEDMDVSLFFNGSITDKLKNITKLYPAKQGLPNFQKRNHVLSAIAKQVCHYINSEYNMKEFISLLLKLENIYQINTVMRIDGEDLYFDHFKVVNPRSANNIELTSRKNYTSTRIRGKISFKIRE